MATIQGWNSAQEVHEQSTGEPRRTLSSWRHERTPVVTVQDLLHGLPWREAQLGAGDVLQPPRILPAGALLGGARSEFVPLRFSPSTGAATLQTAPPTQPATVQVAQPTESLTAGLTDAWHEVVVKSLGVLSTSEPQILTGLPNADGDWVMNYGFDQALPGRTQAEATLVSVTVRGGGATPARVTSLTLMDASGVGLELPFRAVQFPGPNNHRFEVRVPGSLPEKLVLDTYLPNAPESCTLTQQPLGNTLIRFTSSVGLNQQVELDVVPDLHGVYEVCSATVLQPTAAVTVAQPLPGSQPPPVPARFRVAANVEESLHAGLRSTYAGQQLLADNKPFTLRALMLQAQADNVVPTHEPVRGGGDAWVFALDMLLGNGRTLSFALKVRVVDVGQNEADVVDARLVDRVNSRVVWRDDNMRSPNEGLI